MLFEYYVIRPCVEFESGTESFLGNPVYSPETGGDVYTAEEALKEASEAAEGRNVFWTLYGVDQDIRSVAIGDFSTYEAAYEVLQAILVPFRQAYHLIDQGDTNAGLAMIDDICNQSTNEVRL